MNRFYFRKVYLPIEFNPYLLLSSVSQAILTSSTVDCKRELGFKRTLALINDFGLCNGIAQNILLPMFIFLADLRALHSIIDKMLDFVKLHSLKTLST